MATCRLEDLNFFSRFLRKSTHRDDDVKRQISSLAAETTPVVSLPSPSKRGEASLFCQRILLHMADANVQLPEVVAVHAEPSPPRPDVLEARGQKCVG